MDENGGRRNEEITQRAGKALVTLARMIPSAPASEQARLVDYLLEFLRQMLSFTFEERLYKDKTLIESFTHDLVAELLCIAIKCPQFATTISQEFSSALARDDLDRTFCMIMPSLIGLLDAIEKTEFVFPDEYFRPLLDLSGKLLHTSVLDRVREAVQAAFDQPEGSYAYRLARVALRNCKLSGNYLILCYLRVMSAYLARHLNFVSDQFMPQAAMLMTDRWAALSSHEAVSALSGGDEAHRVLRGAYVMAGQYFSDLYTFAITLRDEDKICSSDLYASDIMSVSLMVSTLSAVHLRNVDESLLSKLDSVLVNGPLRIGNFSDTILHSACLQACTILVKNFRQLRERIGDLMANALVSPATSWQTMDDVEVTELRDMTVNALGCCMKVVNDTDGDERVVARINMLLNALYALAITSDNAEEDYIRHRLVSESIVSAIAGIASILKDNKVTAFCLSILSRRLGNPVSPLDPVILAKLVDIALVAPETVFEEVIHMFTHIGKQRSSSKNAAITAAALQSQLSLANRINSRPDLYEALLKSLLNQFNEKGVMIQQMIQDSGKNQQMSSLAAELGVLLPVLHALISHDDFDEKLLHKQEAAALMRNVWFHCVLFGFCHEPAWLREWGDALRGIAMKTPLLVPPSAAAYLDEEIALNSVLRRGFSDQIIQALRNNLALILSEPPSALRQLSFGHHMFLLAVYYMELFRAQSGSCSHVFKYFEIPGVNENRLAPYLRTISDKILEAFIDTQMQQADSINEHTQQEMRSLMIGSCHGIPNAHVQYLRGAERMVGQFPMLMADCKLVYLGLELVHLLWLSCEAETLEEYSTEYHFTSQLCNVTLELPDNIGYRRDLLSRVKASIENWIIIAYKQSPDEVSAVLQHYLFHTEESELHDLGHTGRVLALQIGQSASHNVGALKHTGSSFLRGFASRQRSWGQVYKIVEDPDLPISDNDIASDLEHKLETMLTNARRSMTVCPSELSEQLHRAAVLLISAKEINYKILDYVCDTPVAVFTPESMRAATSVWLWLCLARPEIEPFLAVKISLCWSEMLRGRKGIFSESYNLTDPMITKMHYAPSEKNPRYRQNRMAIRAFAAHTIWIKFFANHFEVVRMRSQDLVRFFTNTLIVTFYNRQTFSNHPLAREPIFRLIRLGLRVLERANIDVVCEYRFRSLLYNAAFVWFSGPPKWSSNGNNKLAAQEVELLLDVYQAVQSDTESIDQAAFEHQTNMRRDSTQLPGLKELRDTAKDIAPGLLKNIHPVSLNDNLRRFSRWRRLLLLLLESEISRLGAWNNPILGTTFTPSISKSLTDDAWKNAIRYAWDVSRELAFGLLSRYRTPILEAEVLNLLTTDPNQAVGIPEAMPYLVEHLHELSSFQHKYLLYWHPVPPVTAITYFMPQYTGLPQMLQYAIRSLEHFDVNLVFFYIPQLVQALRYDRLGYVEKYIIEAARVSQYFAHQIIWNMKANMYKDEDSQIPDDLKSVLDRIVDEIVNGLSGEDRSFYTREFTFFNEVTGISGKLKPFIKSSKEEKKKKIDEEIRKVHVDVGVYLPSNPDGIVIGIDYQSGRPLQSHAKAPFMATFRIQRTIEEESPDTAAHNSALVSTSSVVATCSDTAVESKKKAVVPNKRTSSLIQRDPLMLKKRSRVIETWLSAIFKVGDDCRQDLLALQLIAMFRSIFDAAGLDLWVFPYRVVATAPGCGVIDVIPNSISRDQLGREKVNSLYDYYITKFGGVDSIRFQQARNNFIKSVAAYSVISYLLQFKDRHNGNIMIDSEGYMIHIDFGFILDISPGGINFESSPFKLTAEMIQVMGGNAEVQPYKWFCELCINAYLASRSYMDQICQMVELMLDSGLPCFKGETIKRLKYRFQPERTEQQAAQFMLDRIKESFENRRTVWYDSFQKATNGIPY
ncbi:hypothetical protein BDF19DRAFT_448167 [Syncephalis fuscata]|nr:hypothetical protein BDF19DRAFT_448167 [Syncephalis fuscata]